MSAFSFLLKEEKKDAVQIDHIPTPEEIWTIVCAQRERNRPPQSRFATTDYVRAFTQEDCGRFGQLLDEVLTTVPPKLAYNLRVVRYQRDDPERLALRDGLVFQYGTFMAVRRATGVWDKGPCLWVTNDEDAKFIARNELGWLPRGSLYFPPDWPQMAHSLWPPHIEFNLRVTRRNTPYTVTTPLTVQTLFVGERCELRLCADLTVVGDADVRGSVILNGHKVHNLGPFLVTSTGSVWDAPEPPEISEGVSHE